MAQGEIGTYLRFALQQIAAESYLDGIDLSNPQQVIGQLQLGNNNITGDDPTASVLPGKIRMTRPVSYTHLRAHETVLDLVCRLLLEKKHNNTSKKILCL